MKIQSKNPKFDKEVWHDRPAGEDWLRALPVGNGRMGAMVFGNPGLERIQLNEDTFYALEPETCRYIPKGVPESLPGVVELLKEGKIVEAEKIVSKNWLGRSNAPYLPLADLWIDSGHTGIENYQHSLSLREAVVSCSYSAQGNSYLREVFLSHPDQVLALRFTSETPGALNFNTWISSPHQPTFETHMEGDVLVAKGQGPGEAMRRSAKRIEAWGDQHKYPDFYEQQVDGSYARKVDADHNLLYGDEVGGRGMFFELRLQVLLPGAGTWREENGHLIVENADEAVILLTADTSFNGIDKSPSREGVDPAIQCQKDLAQAASRSYADVKQRHIEDYSALFDRIDLGLGPPGPNAALPTDQRIARFHEGKDPSLPVLYYTFSRYLMIAGSRPGTQPLNLQGIWNEEMIPPWNCGYTTNINAEMNYWDVLRGNLTECNEPFLRMVRETYPNGKKVADEMFGYRGWCMFHNISIWRSAAPVDGAARTSWWPVGAGWFCQHLWHHVQMTRDLDFLSASFEILRDASLFFCDWLIDRGDGKLVTPVSTSPENRFFHTNENGIRKPSSLCMGSGMDRAIVWETLSNTLLAAEALGIATDGDLMEIRQTRDQMADYGIRAAGALMEWHKDFEEEDPQHRHISHLYGFFPGDEITPEKRPDLVPAVQATLEHRGDGASGWAMGWKLNCWARLGDGEHFYRLLHNLLTPERTAQNMLCLHPPYQIDGNFGTARGITEALIQDHRNFIDLLPALPPVWKDGCFRGLLARGGVEVDLEWADHIVTKAVLTSKTGGIFRVKINGNITEYNLKPGIPMDWD
jgi:alpha-L-fucosidase 2